ncbi:MAG: hypothetical protein GX811_04750, partial [Lentisphaerae bacterium]|nr:hypothetical protein [Lentisphaerota bacterium]
YSDDEPFTVVSVSSIEADPAVVALGDTNIISYTITTSPAGFEFMVSFEDVVDASQPGIYTNIATCGSSTATCTVTVLEVTCIFLKCEVDKEKGGGFYDYDDEIVYQFAFSAHVSVWPPEYNITNVYFRMAHNIKTLRQYTVSTNLSMMEQVSTENKWVKDGDFKLNVEEQYLGALVLSGEDGPTQYYCGDFVAPGRTYNDMHHLLCIREHHKAFMQFSLYSNVWHTMRVAEMSWWADVMRINGIIDPKGDHNDGTQDESKEKPITEPFIKDVSFITYIEPID